MTLALNEIERLERPKWLKSEREAKLLVAAWNVRVRATLIARRFYLGCLCPGCGQRGSVDLRRINRHPDASLESLIPMLSCQRCSQPAVCQTYWCIAQAALVQQPPTNVRHWG